MIAHEDAAVAIAALRAGALGILPTDTVYGLAAWLADADAVAALYALKRRPRSQACQVLTYDAATLDALLESLPPDVARIARALLPGPVTCVVPDEALLFAAAAGDAPGSVGVRAPVAAAPLRDIPGWFVATSANEPGGRDPSEVDHVPERIRNACSVILDAGPLPGTASAVVDLRPSATGGEPVILRPGNDPAALAASLQAIRSSAPAGGDSPPNEGPPRTTTRGSV
ncbi:MAG: Sua5/YciO/YrdC/YwlC family protein [Actinobacteria bacterium]|nr:Sua5/YciO/YrdC/YwlC family protein [Actinomycetota bacterium]